MNPEQQRIAIAEACGWYRINPSTMSGEHIDWGMPSDPCDLPDYLNDLNAMQEALAVLNDQQKQQMMQTLSAVVGNGITDYSWQAHWRVVNATAAQRAEAFLKTMGKREGEQP